MTEPRGTTPDHPLEETAELVRLPVARVRRYVRVGLVRPSRTEGSRVYLSDDDLPRLRRIRRLGDDLGLDAAAIEVVMRLLDEIDSLRRALGTGRDARTPGGSRWP